MSTQQELTEKKKQETKEQKVDEILSYPASTAKKQKKFGVHDYTDETKESIQKADDLINSTLSNPTTAEDEKAKKDVLHKILEDILLPMEKKVRVAADGDLTTKILAYTMDACGKLGDYKELIAQLHALAKKRNQIKQAITKMVQTAMEWIDKAPSKETKIELIKNLREVSEGKVSEITIFSFFDNFNFFLTIRLQHFFIKKKLCNFQNMNINA